MAEQKQESPFIVDPVVPAGYRRMKYVEVWTNGDEIVVLGDVSEVWPELSEEGEHRSLKPT